LLGATVQLPADELVALADEAGLGFVVADLVQGPYDEVLFRRLARAAHRAGLGVVALIAHVADPDRLRALGADGVASPGGPLRLAPEFADDAVLELVEDIAAARRAIARGTRLVALDVAGALAGLLRSFADAAEQAGDAEAVVLLPGMLGDARVFEDVVAALPQDVSCRALRIDLDESIGELAESILAVAPERFALVGHSLGGIVALEIWRRAPARVARLALLNTSARPPSEDQLTAWATLRDRTEAGEFAELVAEQAAVNLGASAATDPALVERWVDMADKVGPDGLLRQLRAQATRPDSRPSLATIAVPTMVLGGSADTVCPPHLQAELAAGIPAARHVTVDGAAHMTPLERPQDVAAHIAAWLVS
jgi:pimeloyl-ACP methyl ester carboxylesterase